MYLTQSTQRVTQSQGFRQIEPHKRDWPHIKIEIVLVFLARRAQIRHFHQRRKVWILSGKKKCKIYSIEKHRVTQELTLLLPRTMGELAPGEGDICKVRKGWPKGSGTRKGQRRKFLLFIVFQETEHIPRRQTGRV